MSKNTKPVANEHLVKLGAPFPGEWVLIYSPGTPWDTDGSVVAVDHDFDKEVLAARFWAPHTPYRLDTEAHYWRIPPDRMALGMPPECPNDGLCQKCRERPATLDWVGDGGTLAWAHGMSSRWCEICALRAQVVHCREAVERLPSLEAKLDAELAKERSHD